MKDTVTITQTSPQWPRIKPMDIVLWAGDEYLVLENHGPKGVVVETFSGGHVISNFHWVCGDEACKVIGNISDAK